MEAINGEDLWGFDLGLKIRVVEWILGILLYDYNLYFLFDILFYPLDFKHEIIIIWRTFN
jgi:hypothetical protein